MSPFTFVIASALSLEAGVLRRCVTCKQRTRQYWCDVCAADFKCKECGFCPGCTFATPPREAPLSLDAARCPDSRRQPSAGPVAFVASRPQPLRCKYTAAEDAFILRSFGELGPAWRRIAASLPDRTATSVQRRYCKVLRTVPPPPPVSNHGDATPTSHLGVGLYLRPSHLQRASSPYVGVDLRKSGRYRARVQLPGVDDNLGLYDTALEAAHAYAIRRNALVTPPPSPPDRAAATPPWYRYCLCRMSVLATILSRVADCLGSAISCTLARSAPPQLRPPATTPPPSPPVVLRAASPYRAPSRVPSVLALLAALAHVALCLSRALANLRGGVGARVSALAQLLLVPLRPRLPVRLLRPDVHSPARPGRARRTALRGGGLSDAAAATRPCPAPPTLALPAQHAGMPLHTLCGCLSSCARRW